MLKLRLRLRIEVELKPICLAYVVVVQALITISLVISIAAFVIGCVAYCKREWRSLYKIAGAILIAAGMKAVVIDVKADILTTSDVLT